MKKHRIIITLLVAIFFAITLFFHKDALENVTINFAINQIIGFLLLTAILIFTHENITSKKLN